MDSTSETTCKEHRLSVPTVETKKKGKGHIIPSRYIIVLLGFSTAAVMTCQRMNLSMGLVAMVNQTVSHNDDMSNWTAECPIVIIIDEDNEHHHHHHHHHIGGYFNWDSEIQGQIVSASFFGFMISQTPGGRMAESFGARQVLLLSILLASLCNLLSPVIAEMGPYALLGIQLIKGVAQGVQQPAVNCLMANWFPKLEKGFLSSVVFSGYPGGCVIGGLVCGILCDSSFLGGWPSVFYVFGFLGLLLVVAFYYLSPNTPEEDTKISEEELKYILSNLELNNSTEVLRTPWKAMLMSYKTWAFILALFGQYWMMFYLMTGYPIYLSSILHFSHSQSGYMNSFPYIGQMIIPYIASYLSSFMAKRGYSSIDSARRACNSLRTLFGTGATIASLSGFLIPLIIGALTQQQTLAQWNLVIYISVVVVLISGIVFHFFGSADLQPWDSIEQDADKDGVVNDAFEYDGKYEHPWKIVEDKYMNQSELESSIHL